MTLQEFIDKWLGKKCDWDGYYGGQCVDLFRQYVQEVLVFPQPKGVTGAKDFWTNYDTDPALYEHYEKIPNTPEGLPSKGDVVIWNGKAGSGYGHVAIFISGDLQKFTSFDENWPTLDKCTLTDHNYTNVSGWLHPIKEDNCEDALIEMRESRNKWKLQCEEDKEKYAKDIADKNEHIKLMQSTMAEQNVQLSSNTQTIKDMTLENKRLLDDSAALRAEYVALTTSSDKEIDTLNDVVKELTNSNSDLGTEVSNLKKKLKAGLVGYTRWELFKQLFRR